MYSFPAVCVERVTSALLECRLWPPSIAARRSAALQAWLGARSSSIARHIRRSNHVLRHSCPFVIIIAPYLLTNEMGGDLKVTTNRTKVVTPAEKEIDSINIRQSCHATAVCKGTKYLSPRECFVSDRHSDLYMT